MKRSLIFLLLVFTVITGAQQRNTRIAGGNGELYFSPMYSPDGTMLAFTSDKYQGIWIYDFQDQSIRQLTDEIAAGFGFIWSKDSKNILTRVAQYDGMKRLNAVKIFDVESGESQNLSGYKTRMPVMPQWSNDDSKVFTYTESLEVYSTGKISSPNSGSKIAFVLNDKIATGDADSKNIKTFEPVKNSNYINLSVSPDASKIVFEIVGGNMYTMNFDGTGLDRSGNWVQTKMVS
jgi:Tol biopolymer transport system component